jgi:hypothetical protein
MVKALDKTEKFLKVTLPQSFKDLYKNRNGGAVRKTSHKAPRNSWTGDHITFQSFPKLSVNKQENEFVDQAETANEEWKLQKGVLAFWGEGHYWICLDYRKSGPKGEPAVVWADQDEEEEDEDEAFKIIPVAPDFATFLKGLCLDKEQFIYLIKPTSKGDDEDFATTVKNCLEKIKGFEIDSTGKRKRSGNAVESFTAKATAWESPSGSPSTFTLRRNTGESAFPKYSDKDLLLEVDIKREQVGSLEAQLKKFKELSIQLVHRPCFKQPHEQEEVDDEGEDEEDDS